MHTTVNATVNATQQEMEVLWKRDYPTAGQCPRCNGALFLNPEEKGKREVGCMECDFYAGFLALGSCGQW